MPDSVAVFLVLGLLAATFVLVASLTFRLARVERKLDAYLRHTGVERELDGYPLRPGVEPADVAAREALPHIRRGDKIMAVKVYRELSGVTLAEAKAAVEKL